MSRGNVLPPRVAPEPKPVAIEILLSCMWSDHGRLRAYLGASGEIHVAPCDRCLAENSRQADERWKAAIGEALDGR